ncbi:MAG: DUF2461 domain-containing protein [Bacteroidales bacterium]|jgi:uncharacterized protein (TIGR02453 family)|nr:DUF2461 domain-containing protein [Bacteroidales bacterium]
MNIPTVLQFIDELIQHNNREWFAENKDRYEATRAYFETISSELIREIMKFDDDIAHVEAKDCIFRIYRDIRFSHDKTPYKNHYGVFIAAAGGRKSVRGGYYLHLEPSKSFVATGVWCPPPPLLKALRETVYENIDELTTIIQDPGFTKWFDGFYDDDKLKSVPRGFPADFEQAELLKLKHYMVEYTLPESILNSDNFVQEVAAIFKAAWPLNKFLNYTVDEVKL